MTPGDLALWGALAASIAGHVALFIGARCRQRQQLDRYECCDPRCSR